MDQFSQYLPIDIFQFRFDGDSLGSQCIIKICGLQDPSIVDGLPLLDFLGYVVGSPKSKRNLNLGDVLSNENIIEDRRSVLVTVDPTIWKRLNDEGYALNFQIHGSARDHFIKAKLDGIRIEDCSHSLFHRCNCLEDSEVVDRIETKFLKHVALGISYNELEMTNNSPLKQFLKPILWNEKLQLLYLTIDSVNKEGYGGTGNRWKWREIPNVKQKVLVAGGINPSNAMEALRVTRADGIDISSGVETSKGKDKNLILQLIQNISRAKN